MKDIYEQARIQILKDLRIGLSFPVAKENLSAKQVKKIEAHAARFGHTIDQVFSAVLQNEVAYFAIVGKNPGRMDYYEDTLVRFLEKEHEIARIKKLPKSGPNAKHIWRGEIHTGGGKRGDVKSLDLEVEFKNGHILYVVHKFTKEGGGAQDNQYREAKSALSQVRLPSGMAKVNLAAVLDGDYYSKTSSQGISKLEATKLEHTDAVVCTYMTFISETKSIWGKR